MRKYKAKNGEKRDKKLRALFMAAFLLNSNFAQIS